MASRSIKSVQQIPAPLEKVWDFFSDPSNLRIITPEYMKFRTISESYGDKIYAGQIIEYKVSPVFGIPMYWMTEITQVKEKEFFIDNQVIGPYKLWHHQHHFKSIENGTEMTDIVHYKSMLGFLGRIAESLFVNRQLKKIFAFREQKVIEIFGQWGRG